MHTPIHNRQKSMAVPKAALPVMAMCLRTRSKLNKTYGRRIIRLKHGQHLNSNRNG